MGAALRGRPLFYINRKDLFEDPKEKDAFKAKYGRDLAVAKTWDEYYDIAEFFYRPDQSLWGSAMHMAAAYDAITCNWNQMMWSYGGELWDGKNKVVGFLNGEARAQGAAVHAEALQDLAARLRQLVVRRSQYRDGPGPGGPGNQLVRLQPGPRGPEGVQGGGQAGLERRAGVAKHFVHLGGEGLTVSAYSKNQEAVLDFIKWFWSEEAQKSGPRAAA